MASGAQTLRRMREICLSLPDTKETLTWGRPHFRVKERIFAGCGEDQGRWTLGFKLEVPHAAQVVEDPRFRPAPYVGHKGWIQMDASGVRDWEEVRAFVLESYRLIAPKRSLAKLATPTRSCSEASSTRRRRPGSRRAPR
jgi:predicted DNA-binding protein (MmcQ/YjbR family)